MGGKMVDVYDCSVDLCMGQRDTCVRNCGQIYAAQTSSEIVPEIVPDVLRELGPEEAVVPDGENTETRKNDIPEIVELKEQKPKKERQHIPEDVAPKKQIPETQTKHITKDLPEKQTNETKEHHSTEVIHHKTKVQPNRQQSNEVVPPEEQNEDEWLQNSEIPNEDPTSVLPDIEPARDEELIDDLLLEWKKWKIMEKCEEAVERFVINDVIIFHLPQQYYEKNEITDNLFHILSNYDWCLFNRSID